MRVLFTLIVLACARILSASAPDFTILDASSFRPITATLILPSGESIELKKGWTKPAELKTGLYTIKSAGFKSISFSLEQNAPLPERIRIWLDPANARPASSGLVVLDQQSGLPVKGIKIKDLANGYLLSAKGYRSLHFSPSYRIAETLYLLEMQAGRGRRQIREVHGLDFESNDLLAGPAAGARGASCTPPATIRVGTNCNCTQCTQVEVMSLETYTAQGLNDEWIPSWNTESLKAGSVAYRSFGAWYVINQALPGVNYDIASSTCNQVWTPSLSAACASAAAATAGELLEQNAAIARSEYSAEANFETGCANGQKGDGSAQWPCSSDSLCAGNANSGHGRGMCQWGSQRWASQRAWTYTQILDHYYNIGGLYRCGTAPLPCTAPPAPQIFAPGSSGAPGPTAETNLQWSGDSAANVFNLRISQCPYGTSNIIWSNSCSPGLSLPLPLLPAGNLYRWNISASSTCGNADCTSGSSNTLYFNIPPVITTSDSVICGSPALLYTQSGNTRESASFQWFRDNDSIPGFYGDSLLTALAGDYKVRVLLSSGATSVSEGVRISSCTSIESDSENDLVISIRGSHLFVKSRYLVNNLPFLLTIYAPDGRLVAGIRESGFEQEFFPLPANMPAGLYVVSLQTSEQTISRRLFRP
jgi:hypothetical protein